MREYKHLGITREKVEISLPLTIFGGSFEYSNIVNAFDELEINDSYLSSPNPKKQCLRAKGFIAPQAKLFLQYSLGKEVLNSKIGEEYYFDITSTNIGTLRKRDLFLSYSSKNDFISSLLEESFLSRLSSYGLKIEPEKSRVYGFEELSLRSPKRSKQLKEYLDDKITRNIHTFNTTFSN